MAAEREPEEVDPLQAERIDGGDPIPCRRGVPFVGSRRVPQTASLTFKLTSGDRISPQLEKQTRCWIRPGDAVTGVGIFSRVDLKDKRTKRICSVADALAIVGDRYSLLIVREIGYGYVRFEDLAGFTGAPRDVLTTRLRRLEEVGVLDVESTQSTRPATSIT